MIDLDCGTATPEAYDDESKEALHVFNVNLIGDANAGRVLAFVCARIQHFARHLPRDSSQRVIFDVRGQAPNRNKMNRMRQTIIDTAADQGISVSVGILS